MSILITGGAGYIGSHAVYAFLDAGYDVVVADNLVTGVRENLPGDIPFAQGDVGDAAFLDDLFGRHAIDGVLHFAGSIVVPESVENPAKYYRNNTFASLVLAEACVRHSVPRLLFSSTAAVYGLPETGVATEDSPTRPINPYGMSKLMIEHILADMSHAHGLRYAALRYFNVAGADPRGRTGQSTPQATHLIKVACQVATGQRERMAIFGTDYDTRDGTCVRDYIHVSDLAEAHLAVYRHLAEVDRNLTFNCGNGRGYSVREVIDALQDVLGHEITVDLGDRRAGDPAQLIADPSRLRQAVDWTPRHTDLREIIMTALEWERRQA